MTCIYRFGKADKVSFFDKEFIFDSRGNFLGTLRHREVSVASDVL